MSSELYCMDCGEFFADCLCESEWTECEDCRKRTPHRIEVASDITTWVCLRCGCVNDMEFGSK